MKTKNKMIAMVEIAIVLCSLFLVATLPAIAAEQNLQKASTTASEDDYVLDIYGNANEDDTIDMGDVVYIKLAIFGKKDKTELCDAKYDGRINVLDVIQTKLIILGKEKQLTFVDTAEKIVTVKKPIERVAVFLPSQLETLRSLNAADTIVGLAVAKTGKHVKLWDPVFTPEVYELPSFGFKRTPDYEALLKLDPDAAFLFSSRPPTYGDTFMNTVRETLKSLNPDIAVFGFGCDNYSYYAEEVRMLGYIFDKRNEAEEFIEFHENVLNSVKETVKNIPEEDKPKVYFETFGPYSIRHPHVAHVAYTGGKDIFSYGYDFPYSGPPQVDPEAVIDRDPDIILRMNGDHGYGLDAGDIAGLKEIRDEIINRPELQEVPAVKNERVCILSNDFQHVHCGYNGARNFIQIAYMAKVFHPELFKDMDPKAIHQEYLTEFQGLDIDLDKQGVFWYPEPN